MWKNRLIQTISLFTKERQTDRQTEISCPRINLEVMSDDKLGVKWCKVSFFTKSARIIFQFQSLDGVIHLYINVRVAGRSLKFNLF